MALLFAVATMVSGVILYFALLRAMDKLTESDRRVKFLEKEIYDHKTNRADEQLKPLAGDDSAGSQEVERVVSALLPVDETGDINVFLERLLISISKQFEIVQGVAHVKMPDNLFHMAAAYAYSSETEVEPFTEGETLAGQTAQNKTILHLQDIPEGYLSVLSGLGKGEPFHLLIIPIVSKDEAVAIVELASFVSFDEHDIEVFEKLRVLLAEYMVKLNSSLQ